MIVASLKAILGLEPDMKSWSAGSMLINTAQKAVQGLTFTAAAFSLKNMISETLDLGGHLSDVSQKLGVSAEALQRYGYAASQAGASQGALETGFRSLSRVVSAAKSGSKESRKAFKDLGLSWKELAKLSPEDQFLQIADAIAKLPDGSRKTTAAMAVLGRGGADLIPMLNGGAAGLRAMAREFDATGKLLSNRVVADLDEAGDAIDRLKTTFSGIGAQVAVGLLPMIQAVTEGLQDFVDENRALIQVGLRGVLDGITGALKAVGEGITFVTDLLGDFGDKTELVTALAQGLGVALTVVAIKAAVAWAATLAPFLALAAAIAGIILVVKKLRSNWDGIVSTIRSGISRARDAVTGFVDDVTDHFAALGQVVAAPFVALKNLLAGTLGWIADKVDYILGGLKAISNWWNGGLKGVRQKLGLDNVAEPTGSMFGGARAAADSANAPFFQRAREAAAATPAFAPFGATPAPNQTISNVFHITQRTGEDGKALADRMMNMIRGTAAGVGIP